MDHLELIVKPLTVLIGTLAPILKAFFGHMANRTRHLDERYKRLKAFFEDGAAERHPMLVEASFASAVGHAKLSSQEIELLLRQKRPTEFMNRYLRSRDYITPNEVGDQFELRGVAKHAGWRKALVMTGAAVYGVLAGLSFWALVYVVLPQAPKLEWAALVGAVSMCMLGLLMATVTLIAAGKLHNAAKLFELQMAPNTQPASTLAPIAMNATPSLAALSLGSNVAAPPAAGQEPSLANG